MPCKQLPVQGKFKFAFWNFLDFIFCSFFLYHIFHLRLVESVDPEYVDMESQIYKT